jgi:DNA-binding response OmpR family regulator
VEYFGTTRTLDQHVAQLRKKLDPSGGETSVIHTVHGVGYRYEP